MANRKKTRFSDYFKLGKNQSQLDFVDIPIETDIPLYVDPYALHISSQDWLRECGNNVVAYFQILVEKIRANEQRAVLQLLDNFHEPNETHLGQSSGRPSGRGRGREQAETLHKVLKGSVVVKTGNLSDLGDYEMFIPGIGPDKISDLATNVIKDELITYTEEQCSLLGIPVDNVNTGKIWNSGTADFRSRFVNLPLCPSGPIILVPKTAVRTQLIPDRSKFYSRFVLDYLESEHLTANDSLVKLLKSGVKKVYRKDLRKEHPLDQEQLYRFSREHPDILKRYKDTLPAQAKPISDLDIEWRQPIKRNVEASDLAAQLDDIKPGRSEADRYHMAILGILVAVFHPSLTRPVKEQAVDEGRKRIDISFDNSADAGFFAHLVNRHKVFAPYVAVECKNYSEDPENPEFDQLKGRFSRKRGNFGILVCRKIEDHSLMIKRCKDVVNNTSGIIIVLEDADIKELVHRRSIEDGDTVSDFMSGKLAEVLS